MLDDLKMSYHNDDSDDDELAVTLRDKPGDENTACNFSKGVFSGDVRMKFWIRSYKCEI